MSLEEIQRLLILLATDGEDPNEETTVLGQVGGDGDEDDSDYVDEEEGGDDDDDEEEEEQDDEEDARYNWGLPEHARPWDRTNGWWPKVTKPEKKGLELLFGGEFGRIQHQLRSRNSNRNVARMMLSRGTRPRPIRKEDIASVRR